jgi:hypothetical protein
VTVRPHRLRLTLVFACIAWSLDACIGVCSVALASSLLSSAYGFWFAGITLFAYAKTVLLIVQSIYDLVCEAFDQPKTQRHRVKSAMQNK